MIVIGRQVLVFSFTVFAVLTLVLAGCLKAPPDCADLDAWCQVEETSGASASLDAKDGPTESGESDSEEDPDTKVFSTAKYIEHAPPWPRNAGGLLIFDEHLSPGRATLSSVFRPPRA